MDKKVITKIRQQLVKNKVMEHPEEIGFDFQGKIDDGFKNVMDFDDFGYNDDSFWFSLNTEITTIGKMAEFVGSVIEKINTQSPTSKFIEVY